MFEYCLKAVDIISPNPSVRIHFGAHADHKTITGGICSIVVIISLLAVAGL